MTSLGLNREAIKKSIQQNLDENADLLIGVDDPEVNELINVLVEAMVQVIHENNEEISRDVNGNSRKPCKKGD